MANLNLNLASGDGNIITSSSLSIMLCVAAWSKLIHSGIEKTFGKDSAVTKIDVDLASGKVLLAYAPETEINRAGIEQNILNNGLNTTAIQLVGK